VKKFLVDWGPPIVALLGLLTIFSFIAMLVSSAAEAGRRRVAEYAAWQSGCIEAGGVPVEMLVYVKGIGSGHTCIGFDGMHRIDPAPVDVK